MSELEQHDTTQVEKCSNTIGSTVKEETWIPVHAVLHQLASSVENDDLRRGLEAGSQDGEGVIPPLALGNDVKPVTNGVWAHKSEHPSCNQKRIWGMGCRVKNLVVEEEKSDGRGHAQQI